MVYRIGLLGLGTVGTGVVQILQTPAQRHPLVRTLALEQVGVRSLDKPRDVVIPVDQLTTDLDQVVHNPAVDIVVELLGGLEPARRLILTAIAQKKHVVTANKAVIARYGQEIFEAANQAGVYVLLEAAVAGGIPVIRPLRQSLAGNRLQGVIGIVNGTTNFILTQMSQAQMSFEEALRIAQQKGYAEADPSADVDGWDAADKIAILARLAFGVQVDRSAVHGEGIRQITATDIRYAQEWNFVIKLLAIAERVSPMGSAETVLDLRVHPTLVPMSHPLASVNHVDNAVLIAGEPIGQVMLSGPGAGRGPTASAVVGDLLTLVGQLHYQHALQHTQDHPGVTNALLSATPTDPARLRQIGDLESEFYVRVLARDLPGVIGSMGTCFGKCGISLEGIMQKASHGESAEIVILTHRVRERDLREAIQMIQAMPLVSEIPTVLRVLPKLIRADY